MHFLLLACTVVWLVQCVTLIRFLVAFRKHPSQSGQPPGVSVIVCAHDEEQNIRKLVPKLLSQQYKEFEVIVVEDRSNDETYDYLLEETRHRDRLKMVRVQQKPDHINGKKYALTLGIKAARYDWVLLTDADCMPDSPSWISAMAACMSVEGKEIVIGYSPYRAYPTYLNAFIRFESLVTAIQFLGWALQGKPYMGVGRNLAYSKSLFMKKKGFNRHLSVTGGDDDLFVNDHATRTNTAVCLDKEGLVWSEPKKSWKQFLHQKVRHLAAGKFYRFKDRVRVGVFATTWMLSWFLLLPLAIYYGQSPEGYGLMAAMFLRELILMICLGRASRMLGDRQSVWKIPLLDFNYAIYYLGTGLVALVTKRVRWKI